MLHTSSLLQILLVCGQKMNVKTLKVVFAFMAKTSLLFIIIRFVILLRLLLLDQLLCRASGLGKAYNLVTFYFFCSESSSNCSSPISTTEYSVITLPVTVKVYLNSMDLSHRYCGFAKLLHSLLVLQ